AQLERVDAAVGRDRPRLGHVRDDLPPAPVVRGGAEQRGGVRPQRVHHPEGPLAVTVVGRHLRRHGEDQLSAVARLVLGGGRRRGDRERQQRARETEAAAYSARHTGAGGGGG